MSESSTNGEYKIISPSEEIPIPKVLFDVLRLFVGPQFAYPAGEVTLEFKSGGVAGAVTKVKVRHK